MHNNCLFVFFQGIAEIGTGVGYACGPVIGGFLYKVISMQAAEDY